MTTPRPVALAAAMMCSICRCEVLRGRVRTRERHCRPGDVPAFRRMSQPLARAYSARMTPLCVIARTSRFPAANFSSQGRSRSWTSRGLSPSGARKSSPLLSHSAIARPWIERNSVRVCPSHSPKLISASRGSISKSPAGRWRPRRIFAVSMARASGLDIHSPCTTRSGSVARSRPGCTARAQRDVRAPSAGGARGPFGRSMPQQEERGHAVTEDAGGGWRRRGPCGRGCAPPCRCHDPRR